MMKLMLKRNSFRGMGTGEVYLPFNVVGMSSELWLMLSHCLVTTWTKYLRWNSWLGMEKNGNSKRKTTRRHVRELTYIYTEASYTK